MREDRSTLHVGIIGAGIVGLSSALWLQRAGYRVTLIDRDQPGQGTSFGNAGLFADYARLPFASFSLMCKMPGMLMDSESPLSLRPHYLPALVPYGWHFARACLPANYKRGRTALTAIQQHTLAADEVLIDSAGARDLIRHEGCLGLFSTAEGYRDAREGQLSERREQGVEMELLDTAQVRELEPGLSDFHAGGVFYPNTRFTVSPVGLCQRYAERFSADGGELVSDEVRGIIYSDNGVELLSEGSKRSFDRLVIAAGVSSRALCAELGLKIPLVSERGYHLTLEDDGQPLNRPVGWLDNAVFLTPMNDGVRVAGTAEFADRDAPPSSQRTDIMLGHARRMLGREVGVKNSWVGSRPSTPDSLPVIGPIPGKPRVTLAFGHGHLGLTLGSITGKLVSEMVTGGESSIDLRPFAPERFS